MRTGIDFQSFFHCGDKVGNGFGRDHPVFFLRFNFVSSEHPKNCGVTGLLNNPQFHSEQARAISLASASSSKIQGGDQELFLRDNAASNPSSTNWRRVRNTVERLVSNASAIRSSDHPGPFSDTSALTNIRAFKAEFIGPLPQWIIPSNRVCSSGVNRIPNSIGRPTFAITYSGFIAVSSRQE